MLPSLGRFYRLLFETHTIKRKQNTAEKTTALADDLHQKNRIERSPLSKVLGNDCNDPTATELMGFGVSDANVEATAETGLDSRPARKERRERLFGLTGARKRQMAMAQPHRERAEQSYVRNPGDVGWKNIEETIIRMTEAGMQV